MPNPPPGFRQAFQGLLPVMREQLGLRSLEVMPPEDSPLHLLSSGVSQSLYLPPDGVIGFNTFTNAAWDPQKPKFFSEIARECSKPIVLVDIGANIGLFTRQCASLIPNLHAAFCYEPHEANFELLKRNCAAIANVELINAGIANEGGMVDFFEDPGNCGNYSANFCAMPAIFETSRVKMLSASEQEADWLRFEKPIFYKSDTQGNDELIATSMSPTFWERVSCGVMELWRIGGKDYDSSSLAAILDRFPNKAFEKNKGENVTSSAVLSYLEGRDGQFDDLYFWR